MPETSSTNSARRCHPGGDFLTIAIRKVTVPPVQMVVHAINHLRSCGMTSVPSNVADLVGRTPIVRLTRITNGNDVQLFAKLEAFNPGGSVKDRIGVAMIEAAEREGRIEPGRTTIVEATSGNTGIALAFVCAAKGYQLILTLPEGMSREREGLLRLYGAQVHLTESLGGMTEAVQAAQALAAREDVFLPDQFSNPANPDIHRRTTGPELLEALDGRIDVFVAGVGTGGTVTGVGEALKASNPACRIVAVEPRSSAVLSGGAPGPHKIQGIGAGFVPKVLNRELLDEVIAVDDEDAIATARRLAQREGVLAGISCGAAVCAALEIAARPESRGARIATILPDSGERYVSTPFFAP
jgi:cysteine synthase